MLALCKALQPREAEHVCQDVLQQELRLQLQGCWGARDQNRRSKKTGLGPKTLSIYTLSTCCNYQGAHCSSRHTHTHTPKPNMSRCCIANAAGTHNCWHEMPSQHQSTGSSSCGPSTGLHVQRCSDEPQPQNPSYKHTISCSSTVNTCSPSQSCQQRAQGDKLLRKDAAAGVQREDSQGTKTHWGCTMCDGDSLEALAELGQGAQGTLTSGQGLHTVACRGTERRTRSTRQHRNQSAGLCAAQPCHACGMLPGQLVCHPVCNCPHTATAAGSRCKAAAGTGCPAVYACSRSAAMQRALGRELPFDDYCWVQNTAPRKKATHPGRQPSPGGRA